MADVGDSVPSSRNIHAARTLTAEEIERLEKDTTMVSEFKRNKLEKEAEKNWDLFYKRNTTKFFKDRHWTKREFEELAGNEEDAGKQKVLFEVGCGVGNFIFPLLEEDEAHSLFVYACDFSKRAVQFVKDHPTYDESHCHAFHADVTTSLSDNVPDNGVDMATMIFVLSAIHPDKMLQVLSNVLQTLKPGGVLLFRDYGLYDYAMLRFAPGHKLSEHFYVRQDGTRAFYFSLGFLNELAQKAGYEVQDSQYVHRDTVNKKEGICVPRIFVQAKFIKPQPTSNSMGKTDSTDLPPLRQCVQDGGDCGRACLPGDPDGSGGEGSHCNQSAVGQDHSESAKSAGQRAVQYKCVEGTNNACEPSDIQPCLPCQGVKQLSLGESPNLPS